MHVRDIVGGVLMICFGIFVAYYSARYDLGTFRRMGPGMFPTLLAYSLIAVGALILIPALYKHGIGDEPFELRSFVFVAASLVVFAVVVPRFGMVPAIVALTIVASFADGRLGPVEVLVLSAALSAIALVVFHYFLGTALAPFRWPF